MPLESHVNRKCHFSLSYSPVQTRDVSIVLCSGLSTESKLVVCWNLETELAKPKKIRCFPGRQCQHIQHQHQLGHTEIFWISDAPYIVNWFVALRHSKSYMQTVKSKFNFFISSVSWSKKWQLNWSHHREATTWAARSPAEGLALLCKKHPIPLPMNRATCFTFCSALSQWGYHKLEPRCDLPLSSFSLQLLSPELPALTTHSQTRRQHFEPQLEGSLAWASWETLKTRLISAEAKDNLPLPEGVW